MVTARGRERRTGSELLSHAENSALWTSVSTSSGFRGGGAW